MENLFGEDFKQLRAEMRVRHYAIRTEETYANWVERFIVFHGMKSPRNLGAPAVREYLEYLAVVRKISLSTQRQALNA